MRYLFHPLYQRIHIQIVNRSSPTYILTCYKQNRNDKCCVIYIIISFVYSQLKNQETKRYLFHPLYQRIQIQMVNRSSSTYHISRSNIPYVSDTGGNQWHPPFSPFSSVLQAKRLISSKMLAIFEMPMVHPLTLKWEKEVIPRCRGSQRIASIHSISLWFHHDRRK